MLRGELSNYDEEKKKNLSNSITDLINASKSEMTSITFLAASVRMEVVFTTFDQAKGDYALYLFSNYTIISNSPGFSSEFIESVNATKRLDIVQLPSPSGGNDYLIVVTCILSAFALGVSYMIWRRYRMSPWQSAPVSNSFRRGVTASNRRRSAHRTDTPTN